MVKDMKDYIGDGVYVEWDGEGVWLTTMTPTNAIYLEPAVWINLVNFVERMKA